MTERRRAVEKSVSIADLVFEKIEDAILSGEFVCGDIITELKLCELLDVSRTPVREALTRLRQEGLVKESGKGAIVVGVSEDDLYDIYEVRMRIEGLAAARCAEVITEGQLKTLCETLELQEFYTARNQPESIKKLDSEFHEQIYSYCGSRTLETLLCELHRKVKRYRKTSVSNPERALKAVKEHREIFEAISARDARLAEELTAKHIKNARESIMKVCT